MTRQKIERKNCLKRNLQYWWISLTLWLRGFANWKNLLRKLKRRKKSQGTSYHECPDCNHTGSYFYILDGPFCPACFNHWVRQNVPLMRKITVPEK